MANRIDLYSATGALMPGKPYKIEKVLKLIARRRADWITTGVSAQLLHYTDSELAAAAAAQRSLAIANASDEIEHKGEWRVVQPSPGKAAPSGWQLRHPRVNEVLYAPETR